MKQRWKIAGCVAVIGLLGANIGLESAIWLGAPGTVAGAQHTVETKGNQQTQGAPDKDDTPLIVGVLTLIVLGYQTVIFRQQAKIAHRQMRISAKQTTAATRQATTMTEQRAIMDGQLKAALATALAAEEGLTIAQRPYLVVEITSPDGLLVTHTPGGIPRIDWRATNFGKTPAIIKSSHVILMFRDGLPTDKPYYQGMLTRHEDQLLKADGVWEERPVAMIDLEWGLDTENFRDARTGRKFFFFVSAFIYDDLFGFEHEVGVCWRYRLDSPMGRPKGGDYFAAPYGGEAYNYRRAHKAGTTLPSHDASPSPGDSTQVCNGLR